MKRSAKILIAGLISYSMLVVLGWQTGFPDDPIICCSTELQNRYVSTGKTPSREEVQTLMSNKVLWREGWPYDISIVGTNTVWTLKSEPQQLTLWRRIWRAIACWDFHPKRPPLFGMNSNTMTLTISVMGRDGHEHILSIPPYFGNESFPRADSSPRR